MKRLYDVTAVFSETIVRKRSHNVRTEKKALKTFS